MADAETQDSGRAWMPTKEQAMDSLDRLVNTMFGEKPRARASIPARPQEDDDLVLSAYIKGLEAENDALRERLAAVEARAALDAAKARLLDDCITSGAIAPSSDAYEAYDALKAEEQGRS